MGFVVNLPDPLDVVGLLSCFWIFDVQIVGFFEVLIILFADTLELGDIRFACDTLRHTM